MAESIDARLIKATIGPQLLSLARKVFFWGGGGYLFIIYFGTLHGWSDCTLLLDTVATTP